MMNTLIHLFRLDFFRTLSWLKEHRWAKIVVVFISLLFFGGMAYVFEQVAYYYFFSLHQFEPYGRLTAEYILHSALLISLWFTALSSFVLATNQVWGKDQEWDWLLTQPTSTKIITLWHHWRLLLPNTALLTLLWLPPAIGFIRVYHPLPWKILVPILLILTLLLTGVIQSITTSLAWTITPRIQRHKNILAWIGGFSAIGLSYLLFISVLPASLQSLLRATS